MSETCGIINHDFFQNLSSRLSMKSEKKERDMFSCSHETVYKYVKFLAWLGISVLNVMRIVLLKVSWLEKRNESAAHSLTCC